MAWNDDVKAFKIIIVGDNTVGKTSLLFRYTENAFEEQPSTIGLDYKEKTVEHDDIKYKLVIWDTAGQEVFRTITSSYYRDAQGIIVMYDQNQPLTFSNVRSWLKNVDNYTQSAIRVIVGNKTDLPQKVPKEDVTKLIDSFGDVQHFECSAKDNVNVNEIFSYLLEHIIKFGRDSQNRENVLDVDAVSPKKKKPCVIM